MSKIDPHFVAELHAQTRALLHSMSETVPRAAESHDVQQFEDHYLDGLPIPPSYRDFLLLQDGWEKCWRGFSLGGVATLRQGPLRDEIDRVIDGYAETLGFDIDHEDARREHAETVEFSPFGHLAFGANFEGDLLLFDTAGRDATTSEMPVLMWNPEDGVLDRWPSFEALLNVAVTDALDRLRPG